MHVFGIVINYSLSLIAHCLIIYFQEQYRFIHEAILETVLCGMNEVDSTKVRQEVKKLADVQASGQTGFQEKFTVITSTIQCAIHIY